ncbi:hypothetical protein PFISCL1PPCAC_29154, partial [Pristionchus fissidentatus]
TASYQSLDHRLILFVWCTASFFICLLFTFAAKWEIGMIGLAASILFFALLLGLFNLMTTFVERDSRESRTAEVALEILEQTRTIQIMAVEGYFEEKYARSQQDVKPLKKR